MNLSFKFLFIQLSNPFFDVLFFTVSLVLKKLNYFLLRQRISTLNLLLAIRFQTEIMSVVSYSPMCLYFGEVIYIVLWKNYD